MRLASLFVLVLLPTAALAQSKPPAREVAARDTGAVMYRLADGVYAIIHNDATDDWPHGNTGVIVGPDGVLVIDSNYLPARAVDDIALIRRVTRQPVRFLVNTHWHGDHTHGNGVYRDSFPGLQIIGARASAGFIALNLHKLPTGAQSPGSYNQQEIARREALLAKGSDSTGKALTAEERAELRTTIAQRRFEQAELAKVKVAAPTLTFGDSLTLDLGSRRLVIRNVGVANSPADVVVYLPAERVLFTGDVLVHPLPYTIHTSPIPWIAVLRDLERYPVAALVPGHGPVFAGHEYTTLVRETFEAIRDQVLALYQRGRTGAQAAAEVNIPDFRTRFRLDDGRPVGPISWEGFTRSVAEQMADCVMGYRC